MNLSKKTITVIYKSKYGSSKRYARWIAAESGADLYESSKLKLKDIFRYESIIYIGGLYVGGILGIKFITRNFEKLKDKKIIVVAVGVAPSNEKNINNVLSKNFNDNMREKINFFMLRGAFEFSILSLKDKVLMTALKIMLKMKSKDKLDAESKAVLQMYKKPVNWVDKKAITPVVECVRGGSEDHSRTEE